jgi:hypothetical protein
MLIIGLTACNTGAPNPEDVIDVRKTLSQRAKAIKEKNIDAYREVFMPEYFDGNYRREDLVNEMAALFAKYESIEFIAQKAPVETKMNSARVVQRIVYEFKGGDKPVHGREILQLRRIDGKWYISGGVYTGLE